MYVCIFFQTLVPVILGHAPAGSSIRQFTHYAQSARFNTFRRYNYNVITNLAVYGRKKPPNYNLKFVTAPVYLHYANQDSLVHPKDVELLATKLPNVRGLYLIPSETFNHLDFIWGNVKERLYTKVLSSMRAAEVLR
jgi:lysosomal acid lipase/cholesteryl ester hydrolase